MEQQLSQTLQSGVSLRAKLPKNVVKQERDVEDYFHDVPSSKIRASRIDIRVKPGSKKSTKKMNKWKTDESTVVKGNEAKKGGSKSKKRKMKKKARKCSPALDIAFKLNEPRIDLIQKVVQTLGEDMALRLMSQTLDVESAGGLMTCNGSRRRSPGGVFFHLVKSDKNVSPQQQVAMFGNEEFKRKRVSKGQKLRLNKLTDGLDAFSMTASKSDDTPAAVPAEQTHAPDPLTSSV